MSSTSHHASSTSTPPTAAANISTRLSGEFSSQVPFFIPGHDGPYTLDEEAEAIACKLVNDGGYDVDTAKLAVTAHPNLSYESLLSLLSKHQSSRPAPPSSSPADSVQSNDWSNSQDTVIAPCSPPLSPREKGMKKKKKHSLHQPRNSRTAPLPPSILKQSSTSSRRASLWQRPKDWFTIPKSFVKPLNPFQKPPSSNQMPFYYQGGGLSKGNLPLRNRHSPSPPPSPNISVNSVESEDLPPRALKRVRFPVVAMTQEYRFCDSDESDHYFEDQVFHDFKNKFGIHEQNETLQRVSEAVYKATEVANQLIHTYGNNYEIRSSENESAAAATSLQSNTHIYTPEKEDENAEEPSITSPEDLIAFYLEACRVREERPAESLLKQLEKAIFYEDLSVSIDLSGVLIDLHVADTLSDLFSFNFKLKQLFLERCKLDDDSLKILLHSLLTVDELEELSLRGNSTIKCDGFKYTAIYMKKSKALRLIDLSETVPDKKAMKYISHAISTNRGHLDIVHMDKCGLTAPMIDIFVSAVKRSRLTELSIASNRFGIQGAPSLGSLLRGGPEHDDDSDNISVLGEKEGYRTVMYDTSIRSKRRPFAKLEVLDLSNNDLGVGAQYVAQALRRNRILKQLRIAGNQLDSMLLSMFAEMLTVNSTLELLDLSDNPLSCPSLEGTTDLKVAMSVNKSLNTLHLSNTEMYAEGAIALAEFLPETSNLRRLDVSLNPRIELAGVMAFAISVKMNHSLLCLDLDVTPGDDQMSAYSRDILNTCIRNTELYELEMRKK